MREILFRGKRKDNGEWVQGDFNQWVKGSFILTDNTDSRAKTNIEVIPETVGQYTGLTDKNGKKIFEGDIVKFSYDENDETPTFYSVEWKSDRTCFGYAETADKMLEVDALHCEVIGNTTDNPELLKGGAE